LSKSQLPLQQSSSKLQLAPLLPQEPPLEEPPLEEPPLEEPPLEEPPLEEPPLDDEPVQFSQ
jgi:hypothetical protein